MAELSHFLIEYSKDRRWSLSQLIFNQSIKIGELEAFKKTVNSMIEVTARNEPDTLSYNWFINEEGTECHLLETFKDSEAFITHLNNVGPMFEELFESCTVTRAKIFGKPSDALKELLAPLGVEYFSHFNGISRMKCIKI